MDDTVRFSVRLERGENLYRLLGVSETATDKEIKRAYLKLALVYHPDRQARKNEEETAAATKDFQALTRIVDVLSHPQKRKYYDACGRIDDEPSLSEGEWMDYFRAMFKRVTFEDVEEFERKYVGSEEEVQDVLRAYTESDGDMGRILSTVMLSTAADDERFRRIIDRAIEDKRVPPLACYVPIGRMTKAQKRARQLDVQSRMEEEREEAREAARERAKMGLDGSDDTLRALIASRQQSRAHQWESSLSALEAKYGQPAQTQKRKGKKRAGSHPSAIHTQARGAAKESSGTSRKPKSSS